MFWFGAATILVGGILGYVYVYYTHTRVDKQTSIELTEIPGFLTAKECDRWLEWIRAHPERFQQSSVDRGWFRRHDAIQLSHRRSRQCWLSRYNHLLALGVSLKAKRVLSDYLSGMPYTEEDLQAVVYSPNEYFRPHYDDRRYGRYATLLVYLNDDYEGGETCFPRLNRCVQPEKGKAILFKNYHRTTRRTLWHSFHEGQPVRAGKNGDDTRKYILNLWIHL